MADVLERDWKLFRKRLPGWQNAWMDKLNHEYIELLSGEGVPSEKFWALWDRMREDKRHPGVVVEGCRRSTMHATIFELLDDGTIAMDDLDGFSDEFVQSMVESFERRERFRSYKAVEE